jgi:hypothetical protein
LRQAYDYWQNQPGNYPKPERRNARADPPKGASCTKQEDAEAPQVVALFQLKAKISQTTDSIAPTEFPKSWSATSHARRCRRKHFRCIQPSGGEDPRLDTPIQAETWQDSPQRSGEYLAKPAIHRPQKLPTKRDRTSDPHTGAGAKPEAKLQYIGECRPAQVSGGCRGQW